MEKATLCAIVEAPTPPLAPKTAMMRPTGWRGRGEQAADRAHDLQRADRRDQIVTDAASHQFAIERDIVHADDDHASLRVAYRRELIEPVEDILAAIVAFENDDVRGRRVLVSLDGGDPAAHLNAQMRFGHAPIFAGRLNGGGGLDLFAERLHRDARRQRDALFAAGDVWVRAVLPSCLASGFHHTHAAASSAEFTDFGDIGIRIIRRRRNAGGKRDDQDNDAGAPLFPIVSYVA